MSNKNVEFSNPENLPVEKLSISVKNAGVIQEIKALDKYWMEKRELTLYERPPSGSHMLLGAVDAWKLKAEAYISDLKWLLSLEHHKFWSTVLYHSQVMDALVSFLQEASPPYAPPLEGRDVQKTYAEARRLVLVVFSRLATNKESKEASPPYAPPLEGRDVQKTYAEARRLVLVVFSRLATNKESKSQWMSKEFMAETLYNKFIFTIPIVWDLCLVYGADNPRHVARLLGCVFSVQPKYEGDTAAAVAFVKEAFKYIILQVNKNYDCEGPPNLPETFKGFGEIRRPPNTKNQDKITFEVLKDLVIHLLDTAMTLRVFVEVYPKSVKILRKANFIISIVQLYEHGIPLLYEKLQEVGDPTSVTSVEVEGYIDAARAELIDIFREVLAVYKNDIFSGDVTSVEVEGYIDAARAELIDIFREVLAVYKNDIFSGEGNIPLLVEEYLAVMLDGLSEKLLIKDYHACYPVHDDLELLRQACPDIDTVKTDFILQAIYSNLDEPIPESALTNGTITNGHAETIDNSPEPTRDNEIPDSVKEESLISEVKDILPHLGDGFILKCLKHYGFNAARVINSILEDNLAEPLRGIDQNLPIIPEDPVDNKYLETGINRLNVFDGDEFDIMTRDDVDLSRVHRGKKKEKYKDLKDLLDDKTEVKRVADIYSKYNMVCDEQAMYSDEYDDTYDSDGVAAADAGDDTRRPFVTPRALQQSQRREAEEESEEESEPNAEQPSSSNRNKLDFCVNPEEIRARREASYNARRGRGHRPPPAKNMDVTGKPKGQGQEKDVLHNRDKKEKHKSSRGNHNRRQGAQWKRGQGLLPS